VRSGLKSQESPREGLDCGDSPKGRRTCWTGKQGDEVTFVAAYGDVLRVVSAQNGSDYEDDLEAVVKEGDDLFLPLGEGWTDGLPAYRGIGCDHRCVVHGEEYVSDEGVHTNQVACL
jgi:hypothetical protein